MSSLNGNKKQLKILVTLLQFQQHQARLLGLFRAWGRVQDMDPDRSDQSYAGNPEALLRRSSCWTVQAWSWPAATCPMPPQFSGILSSWRLQQAPSLLWWPSLTGPTSCYSMGLGSLRTLEFLAKLAIQMGRMRKSGVPTDRTMAAMILLGERNTWKIQELHTFSGGHRKHQRQDCPSFQQRIQLGRLGEVGRDGHVHPDHGETETQ